MFFHRFYMGGIVTDRQNTAMYFRVERFHPAVHHFRKTGKFGNGHDRNPCLRDRFHRTAGGNNLHSQFMKAFGKFHDAGLVRYTDQCSFNCHFHSSSCMPVTV